MTCRIVLDNPGAYNLGDTVYGRVVCTFSSTENFRGIRCKFRGREHTAWTERESYYDSSSKSTKYRTVHYSGDNKFLSADLVLDGENRLSPGQYEYPFSFTFPRGNIPNGYNGNYGYIRYYIKANVDKAFAFDYEDEVTLHLVSPINFNDIRSQLQLQPVAYQDEKTICCCCCASDPITMDLVLEKEAFVVGEAARVKVDVTNMSNETIDQMYLKLEMTVESKVTSPSTRHKYDTELIAAMSDTGVGAHGQRTYHFNLVIPQSAIIPNFAGCSLYKQWCVLKAEAVIPGCHSNLEVDTGVKLGHIPLMGGATQVTYVSASEAPGGAFSLPPPVVSPPPYPPGDKAPPYPPEEKAPPYPIGPPPFPVPNGNDMGFAGEASMPLLPGKGMPMPMPMAAPVHGMPSSCTASAPIAEGGPSAPSKAQLAEEEGFDIVDDDKEEPPPPAYNDTMKGPFPGPSAPSAPPK